MGDIVDSGRHVNSRNIFTALHKRRAFTLIELLTVVMIIGILVGIMLPSVGAVLEMATRSACQGNLKAIGSGVAGYANANDGWIPTVDGDSTNVFWDGSNYVNYGKLIAYYSDPSDPNTFHDENYVEDARVFYCPGANGYNDDSTWGLQTVGVSGSTSKSSYYQRGLNQGAPRHMAALGSSKLAGMSDYETGKAPYTDMSERVDYCHWSGMNVLYPVGGNVAWVSGEYDSRYSDGFGGDPNGTWYQLDDH